MSDRFKSIPLLILFAELSISILVILGFFRLIVGLPLLLGLSLLQVYLSKEFSSKSKLQLFITFSALLLIGVAAEFPYTIGNRNYSLALYLFFLLSGLSLSLSVMSVTANENFKLRLPSIKSIDLVWLIVPSFLLLSVVRLLVKGDISDIVDESVYLFQANNFNYSKFLLPLPSDLVQSAVVRQMVLNPDGITGQYPAGWPFLLWLGQILGVQHCLLPMLSSIAILYSAKLAELVTDKRAGVIAALILISNSQFLYYSAGLSSHIPAAAFLVSATYFLVCAVKSKNPALRSVLSGILWSVSFSIRPLTTIGIAIAVLIWILLFLKVEKVKLLKTGLYIVVGAVPVLGLLMFYNFAITGNPIQFGYTYVNGKLHSFGFGLRGLIAYSSDGSSTSVVSNFTPAQAIQGFFRRLKDLLTVFFCLSIPLFLIPLSRLKLLIKAGFPFLILPLVYLLYPFSSSRFLVELLPYIAVATAVLLVRFFLLLQAVLAVFAIFAFQFASSTSLLSSYRNNFKSHYEETFHQLMKESSEENKLLVLVKETGPIQPLLEALYWFNRNGLSGNVVVLRQTPMSEEIIKKYFPDHRIKILEDPYSSDELPLTE